MNQSSYRTHRARPEGALDARRHLEVQIQFMETPPIGWLRGEIDQIRRFPRGEGGNLFFDCRYFRGMIAEGLRTLPRYSEVFREHPNFMQFCRVAHFRQHVPALPVIADFGEEFEQLPLGFKMSVQVSIPSKVFSTDTFSEFLTECGEFIGYAPIRSMDGYGRFRVLSVLGR